MLPQCINSRGPITKGLIPEGSEAAQKLSALLKTLQRADLRQFYLRYAQGYPQRLWKTKLQAPCFCGGDSGHLALNHTPVPWRTDVPLYAYRFAVPLTPHQWSAAYAMSMEGISCNVARALNQIQCLARPWADLMYEDIQAAPARAPKFFTNPRRSQ